jgi:hypothetical protein
MHVRWFYKRLGIAALLTAAFFITGCSSPEKTVETFLVECLSGDYDGAGRVAGPEVVAAFSSSVDDAGGIAPIRSDAETHELRKLVKEYFNISTERRMKSYAVVRWRPDWEAIERDSSSLQDGGFDVASAFGIDRETFRLLVIKRGGRWMVGGVLPSDS